MGPDVDVDAAVIQTLHALLSRFGVGQLFLFGADGEPFWPARTPVRPDEITLLDDALATIARLEATRAKPFAARSPDGRYTVAALAADCDLYIVVLDNAPTGDDAAARVTLIREAVLPAVERLRVGTALERRTTLAR